MISTKKYSLLAYSLFEPMIPSILPYFSKLKQILHKTGTKTTLEEYVASFMLTATILVPGIFLVILIYLNSLLKTGIGLTVIFSILGSLIVLASIIAIYLMYPSYKVNTLKHELDKHIPFAAMHMATIAGTGVPPHMIFKMIGDFEEYGEVAKVCRKVYRNISVLGYDTISALSKEAQITPSNNFRDLLWSIVAVTRSGGDLREMLLKRAEALMDEERRTEAKYIDTLSMLAEIYSTIFVAGTVVIFVLVAIMGIIGGLPLPMRLVLQATTYFIIPLASIAFILVIESSKPSGV
ncbi:type II secretion system F family protein [archaeon]|nr:type II secretion system F family protein [archaeon]